MIDWKACSLAVAALVGGLACSATAQDKSDYNLFKPTPVDQMRSFNTDRPTKSNVPYTVDAGHFQYEGDVFIYSFDNTTTPDTNNTNWVLFNPTFKAGLTSFHPKSWIFYFPSGGGIAIVGSSNLSESALKSGIEWNYRVFDQSMKEGWRDVVQGFDRLVLRPELETLSHDWIDTYEARRSTFERPRRQLAEVADEPPAPPVIPHTIQVRALRALKETREVGHTAGLVVLATGLGKTWLSAFDSADFRRVLFVAHREEILQQAMATFRRVRPNARFGLFTGEKKDLEADILFASIQTLGKARHLRNFPPDSLDYVVVDEFHHAAAPTYRTLISYFAPRFLLGLTATPERTDGGDHARASAHDSTDHGNQVEQVEHRDGQHGHPKRRHDRG